MTQTKQKPVYKVKEGRVEVAVWQHKGPKGTNYSVSMSRSFKKDDQWKKTTGFFAEDVLTLTSALNEVHKWIREQKRIEGRGGNVDSTPAEEAAA